MSWNVSAIYWRLILSAMSWVNIVMYDHVITFKKHHYLTLTSLKYFVKTMDTNLKSSKMSYLALSASFKCLCYMGVFSAGADFRFQTSVDVIFWRLKSVLALKDLNLHDLNVIRDIKLDAAYFKGAHTPLPGYLKLYCFSCYNATQWARMIRSSWFRDQSHVVTSTMTKRYHHRAITVIIMISHLTSSLNPYLTPPTPLQRSQRLHIVCFP